MLLLEKKLLALRLWDKFWSSGIGPLVAIEQITYLLLLRLEEFSSLYDKRPWLYPETDLTDFREKVFPRLEALAKKGGPDMRDAVCAIETQELFRTSTQIIDTLFWFSESKSRAAIYEFLLEQAAATAMNPQCHTPRHIIRALCEMIDPQPSEEICDPACGTAGFLINAYLHHLKRHIPREELQIAWDGELQNAAGWNLSPHDLVSFTNRLWGFETDRTMVRLGWTNAQLHGINEPKIAQGQPPSSIRWKGRSDVVLGAAPLASSISTDAAGEGVGGTITTKSADILFVETSLRLLRRGGRAAIIVPDSFLHGASPAHRELRERLVTINQLHAVISFPNGVFLPATDIKTAALVFTKGGRTDEVWFYEVDHDGFTLTESRDEQPEVNDLWDMMIQFTLHRQKGAHSLIPPTFMSVEDLQEWLETDRQFYATPQITADPRALFIGIQKTARRRLDQISTVTADQVAGQQFNLSPVRYRPAAVPATAERPPAEIIHELQGLEEKIQTRLSKLLAMLEESE